MPSPFNVSVPFETFVTSVLLSRFPSASVSLFSTPPSAGATWAAPNATNSVPGWFDIARYSAWIQPAVRAAVAIRASSIRPSKYGPAPSSLEPIDALAEGLFGNAAPAACRAPG